MLLGVQAAGKWPGVGWVLSAGGDDRLLQRLLRCPLALPPAFVEVSRKVAATVYSLSHESTTRDVLRKHEGQLVVLACSDAHKTADVFAQVLQRVFEETKDATVSSDEGRNVWGVAFEQ